MRIIVFLLIILLVCLISCKDTTGPDDNHPGIDTTSHNFVLLRVDTLGDWFSSIYTVSVLDENNIWVGGTFEDCDSTGKPVPNMDTLFNAAHWDGVGWKLERILFIRNTQPEGFPLSVIQFKAFADSELFAISEGSSFARWDGRNWHSKSKNIGPADHFWARSPKEIYFVGTHCNAAYYDGSEFIRQNMGSYQASLIDIWGDENSVYAVGYDNNQVYGTYTAFASNQNGTWTVNSHFDWTSDTIATIAHPCGHMVSVFRASQNSKLWLLAGGTSGNGWTLYEVKSLSPFALKIFRVTTGNFVAIRVRGTTDNDLYIADGFDGRFDHYNGRTWENISIVRPGIWITDFVVNKDIVAAVGWTDEITRRGIVIVYKHL